ncbi:hypothetical protein P872_23670 [Rhodonellum psychrophilum GCM71 = DSM 17998]|uniref:RES domain-containing protein n=2 Tax=Rhodonellum TaxID=336827 RepID=U5C923_9BACT|nr:MULTISPECIES: RES family NAD+ phosphorylase [Rhodonellum]ERM84712.1 hypothetical protein P872_23670 [Rhodonellum psychrophilum GCM71 = DSM 17998]SDZ12833.1 RES domain-containing protein [Rhodonellum ikkaensis]
MELFRITKTEFSQKLFAPGFSGRWNKSGEEVIYTASSRSLACLENLVHKRGLGETASFRTMVIYVPDNFAIEQVDLQGLPANWNQLSIFEVCQQLGSDWYQSKIKPMLKVPSAVIPDEFNYVINTNHPEFEKVKIIDILPFFFDKRFF